jgi:hypothetical protein
MRRFLPMIVLVVMAPVIAELLYGTVSINQTIALLFVLPIYGAGALLIRELVRRNGRGWASILFLGGAYGIIEEGIALQSFFNNTLYNASSIIPSTTLLNGVLASWISTASMLNCNLYSNEELSPIQKHYSYEHSCSFLNFLTIVRLSFTA